MTIDQSAVVIGRWCLFETVSRDLYLCVIGENMTYQGDWQETEDIHYN